VSTLRFELMGAELEDLALHVANAPTLAETRTMARSAMGVFVELAKRGAPRRSGRFAMSLGYASTLTVTGIELRHRSGGASGQGVPYARFVASGTGEFHKPDPHSSWDVDKLQHFTVAGAEIQTMHTHHPGQHASDFEERAAKELIPLLPAIAATGGRRLARYITTGAPA
jgi:hypothetical protein